MTTKTKKLICQKDKLYNSKDNSFIHKHLLDGLHQHLGESTENEKNIYIFLNLWKIKISQH